MAVAEAQGVILYYIIIVLCILSVYYGLLRAMHFTPRGCKLFWGTQKSCPGPCTWVTSIVSNFIICQWILSYFLYFIQVNHLQSPDCIRFQLHFLDIILPELGVFFTSFFLSISFFVVKFV